jgi:hypothetical protein
MKHLSGIKGLRSLGLGLTEVTDEGIKHCKAFKKLHYLELPAKVTDAGIAELKELAELREIWLYETKITDDGVKHLTNFGNLETLAFRSCRITDKGLIQLKGLKKLRRLLLYSTDVTPAGVEELRKALPECDILLSQL